MADEIVIETTSAEVIEVGVPGPQGPAGAAGSGLETLTTKGDTLYRGDTTGERLPIGSTGQVLKVSAQGIPTWANESGAVTSVNGATGAVTVAAATHAVTHEPGNEDPLQATAALVATDVVALNGVYFWDGTLGQGNRPNFYKTGTRKNTKLQYNSGNNQWQLVRNNVVEAVGVDGPNTVPWGQTWEELVTPTTVSVTRLPLETMVQKLAETGSAATATTSEDGLMSSSDKTKLNGIAAGAEVNVQSNWTEADTASDAFILNKPSTFAPSAHSGSHASTGSDPLAPSDIGAQSIFSVESLVITTTAQVTLTAARAKIYDIVQYAGAAVDVKLPSTNAIQGDVVVLRWGTGSNTVNVVQSNSPAVITTVSSGEQKRFIRGSTDSWSLVPVDTHTHNASAITSGTLDIARIPTGTGSTQVALGDHTHSDATTTVAGFLSAADKTKLDSVASGATANSSDATLLNRANHTGTQAANTITGLAAIATSGSASDLGSGTVPIARLGASGTPSGSTYLAGDNTWKAAGGVTTGSVDNAVLRADGVSGSQSQSSDINIEDATTSTANNVTISNQHSGQTNSSLVLQPKGTGAFILGEKPSATSSSGNARGASAVDLQLIRTNAARVASGLRSALLGGANNTASGQDAVAIGGNDNTASGFQSIVLGGRNNTASADRSVSIADGNTSSGTNSIAMGSGNTASSAQSLAIGNQSRADRVNLFAHGSGAFGTAGDAQSIRAVLRRVTTNNTATELFLEGASVRLTVPANKVISGIINIHGVRSDGSATAHFVRQFQVKNVAGTSSYPYTAALVGTDFASGTSITFNDPDTNGDALSVSVTGIASQTWRWTASVDAVETTYGT